MGPPFQLAGVPVVPPYDLTKILKLCKTSGYHLTKILKLCKISFYDLKVIVLMKEKLFPVSLEANLNYLKIRQKLVGSCGPPLRTGRGACGPPLPLDQNFETL